MASILVVEAHVRRTSGSGKTEQEGHGGGHRVRFGDSAKYSTRSKRRDNPKAVKVQGQAAHKRLSFSLRPVKRGRPPRLDTTTPIPIRSEVRSAFLCIPSFRARLDAGLGAGLAAGSNRLTLHSGRAWGEWEAGGSCIWRPQMSGQVSTGVSGWVSGLPGFSHRAVNRLRKYAVRSSEASR